MHYLFRWVATTSHSKFSICHPLFFSVKVPNSLTFILFYFTPALRSSEARVLTILQEYRINLQLLMFHKAFLSSRASECRQEHRLAIVKANKELTIFINRDPCKTDEEVVTSARDGGVGGWKGWERLWRGSNIWVICSRMRMISFGAERAAWPKAWK